MINEDEVENWDNDIDGELESEESEEDEEKANLRK